MATYQGTFTPATIPANRATFFHPTRAVAPFRYANASSGGNSSTSEIGPFVRNPSPDATADAIHHPSFSRPVRTASNPHRTDVVTSSVSNPSSSSNRATPT